MTEKEKVLVTGAAGFIGSHLIELLSKVGYDVLATDLKKSDKGLIFSKHGIEFIPADITKPKTLVRLFKDKNIDMVFHLAAIFDFSAPKECLFKVNVDGVRNICEAALKAGAHRFIYYSSAACYGRTTDETGPATEHTPLMPVNDYEQSKAIGEAVAWRFHDENDIGLTVIRPTAVYGPRSKYGIYLALEATAKWHFLPYGWDAKESVVHVEDVVKATLALSKQNVALGQAYNIADDNPLTIQTMTTCVAKALRIRPLRIPIKESELKIFAKFSELVAKVTHTKELLSEDLANYILQSHIVDNTKLKRTGYRLIWPDFRKGIGPVIDWYVSKGILKRGSYKK